MGEIARNVISTLAGTISMAALGLCINTYVDVQILKQNQIELSTIVKTSQDLLTRIDKTQAVQEEVVKTLSEIVNDLRR
ncbi:hypothetical protein [Proteus phage 3H10_20]|uniref:Uncharacterized protein n=3 Tax=Privateervirus TaxID=2843440 RepID=A0A7L7SGX4_9CAUD|nr:virion structural protein [Cronobacter phage vB_CsaP_009]YP_009857443.1 virion structural protein [Proteus phage Privateer]YP_010672276.1 virion structural protein [Proteus phage 3H10_20]QIN94804.1 hypothetical protein CPT_Privateer_011 [Proteus phage Privateer]QOC54799.1 hypothetical protein [Proteus phage 3H10_20]BBU72726.1 hypothetical protein [Cronobacter phage vB_CsaP_009]